MIISRFQYYLMIQQIWNNYDWWKNGNEKSGRDRTLLAAFSNLGQPSREILHLRKAGMASIPSVSPYCFKPPGISMRINSLVLRNVLPGRKNFPRMNQQKARPLFGITMEKSKSQIDLRCIFRRKVQKKWNVHKGNGLF